MKMNPARFRKTREFYIKDIGSSVCSWLDYAFLYKVKNGVEPPKEEYEGFNRNLNKYMANYIKFLGKVGFNGDDSKEVD